MGKGNKIRRSGKRVILAKKTGERKKRVILAEKSSGKRVILAEKIGRKKGYFS